MEPLLTPIPRKDRIILGQTWYGLYTLGLAITDLQRIAEDCAMDDLGVPFYIEKLTDEQKDRIEEFNFHEKYTK